MSNDTAKTGTPTLTAEAVTLLADLADGDLSIVQELFDGFLDDAHERVEQMLAAAMANDEEQLRSLNHALCGSAANIGAQRCMDVCQDLSQALREPAQQQIASIVSELAAEVARLRAALPGVIQDMRRAAPDRSQ